MPSNQGPTTELAFREIEPDDNVTGLSLGHENFVGLKTFLKKCAKEYHDKNIAKTYVVVDEISPPRVWGYISIVCSNIQLDSENHPEDIEDYKYKDFPAVKIARLAVDRRIAKKGIGTTMVRFVISLAKDKVMPSVGCRYIVADAKDDAIEFYVDKNGFQALEVSDDEDFSAERTERHPVVFLDLHNL